jgi:adenosylmethionine-8-amino-7-oxononanoate aminotransferase
MNSNFSRNQDLLTRSRRSVWHPCTQMKHHEQMPLVPIARGDGMWLYDFEGNRYLDAISSWWVNLVGHANPRINAALADQLGRLEHVILAGFTHEPVVQLSERLSAMTGLSHCFYGSDGASAVEIALKMSFHYWKNGGRSEKTGFVSLKNGYHGETLGGIVRHRCAPVSGYVCGVVEADRAASLAGLAQCASRGKHRRCCPSCGKRAGELSHRAAYADCSPDRRTAGSGCGRNGDVPPALSARSTNSLRSLRRASYFMPPYVIEEDHMDMLVGATCEILDGMS